MQPLPSTKFRFDDFELDVSRRRLLRHGNVVTLNPKAFDMLRVLVEHNGQLVTKEDLFRKVWHEQIVEESNLTVNMSAIRRALGETAAEPRYITTVSGRGYYFTANVLEDTAEAIVVENRTVSRIVVEDVLDVDETDEAYVPQDVPNALPPAPHRKSWLAAVPWALGLMLFVGAAAVFWYFATGSNATPFKKIVSKRLTSSGRVSNATLSPDGKLFAYAQTGVDGRAVLLLEHVDGSGRVELRPPQFVSYLSITFTPDGSRIYYGMTGEQPTDNGTYRLPAFGGAPEKMTDSFWSRIAFSPDGDRFAFAKYDPDRQVSTLRIADATWRNEREIASRPRTLAFVASTVDWSPDGALIAASAVSDEKTGKQELFVVDVESGAVRQLTRSGWDGVRALAWLGDGRGLIATAGSQDISWDAKLWHVAESDGRAQPLIADLNAYGIVARLSSDKKKLLTVQAQHYSNLWVASADDLSSARQVTHDMIGGLNGWMGLEWLPDDRIVYTYQNKSETIWIMDSDGGNRRQIIPDGGRNHNVSVSADGRLMAFDSDRGGTDEVWISNIDGSGMRQLTNGGSNSASHISPDGKWVLYYSGQSGSEGLWRIRTDASEQATKFTEYPAAWARFSPDGQQVASSCAVEGKLQLCIFTSSDGELIKRFDVPPRANFRLGVHWLPDGKSVAFRDWDHGIWRQQLSGGEPSRLDGLPTEKLFGFGWSQDGKQFAFSRGMAIQDVVLITSED